MTVPQGRCLPGAEQPDGFIALEQIEQHAQRLSPRGGKPGIAAQHKRGVVARRLQQRSMRLDTREPKAGQSALARAEHVAFATQAQIFFSNAKAVLGLAHDREPRFRGLPERRLIEEQASRTRAATADAPAQLMQLCETEALGVLDHHDRGGRHVHADFDDRGGDEEL